MPRHDLIPSALCGLALACTLALAGCSGDDSSGPPPSPSAAASASAADTLVTTGLDQMAAGRDTAARTTFENVLDLEPGNVYAHYNLGLIAQHAGDEARAAQQYAAALDSDPAFPSALYNLGILREGDDLDTAIGLYRRAVAADPEMAPAHMRLGFALLHLGHTKEAEQELARGVQLDPSLKKVRAPSYD